MGEVWSKNPDAVRADILRVASQEFAQNGFEGGRIAQISAKTKTSKRMIYYYFGDKRGLYSAVLENAFLTVRKGEQALRLDDLAPKAALRRLVEFTFDHHRANPDFIRLVMIENIHHAGVLAEVPTIKSLSRAALATISTLYKRGCDSGDFKPGFSPTELHWLISSQPFFNVSNRETFARAVSDAPFRAPDQMRLRRYIADMILGLVCTQPQDTPTPAHPDFPHPSKEPTPMIDPQIPAFLEEWDRQWAALPAGATAQMRDQFFETIAANMRLETPQGVDCETVHKIPSKHGADGHVRVRLFRANGPEAGAVQPCLIYMHGGAWMQGSPETHWDITARIAAWNRQTVISVDYAKAPDHPFPQGVEQSGEVLLWAHENAADLGIDPARISVGGDSAGGNIAAALTLMFRGTPQAPAAQLLIYPACDFDHSKPSYRENAEGPLLKVAGMDAVNAMYCPDPADLQNPLAAPLLAADHSGLPPAMIAVAQNDPLRDSGAAYAQALRAAGVEVTYDEGIGLIHGYLRAMGHCEASMQALENMCKWLRTQDAKA
ncbi:MAG: alpha/beta hydrolase fold domain-containing protein [Paracoccaceae bacterium]